MSLQESHLKNDLKSDLEDCAATPPGRKSISFHNIEISKRLFRFWRMAAGPLLLYTAWYALLSFPLITQFNKAFFMPDGDGPQMIWNVWWVRHAIVDLHQSPYSTHLVHFPYGASLLLHSLSPFNGLINILLRTVLTDIQAFNVIVILGFVASAVATFWLCWEVTRSYWPSIVGGFAFAFCSYRWAHAMGHLPMISTEAMPLFLLGLLQLLKRPRVGTSIATAISLLVVLLFDPYQFFCCVLTVVIVMLWWAVAARPRLPMLGPSVVALAIFFAATAVTSGPIVWAFMRESAQSTLLGMHDPELFSADLVGPWVPDWAWLYNAQTRFIWNTPTASYVEKSVCLGPAVVIAAAFAFFPRRRRADLKLGSAALFGIIAAVFIALCFGPTWRFLSHPVTTLTPYRALSVLIPPLKFGGCPGRMISMAQLAISVLAAAGLSRLGGVQSDSWRVVLITLFGVSTVIESQPRLMMTLAPTVPPWVQILRDDPAKGAVIDFIEAGSSLDLYYQTVHHRPIAMGDLARVSTKTADATESVLNACRRGDYDQLSRLGFAFIVTRDSAPALRLPLIYEDRRARLYRVPLKNAGR